MTRFLEAELLQRTAAEVGEGPVWDDALDALVWVDIPLGSVHVSSASGELQRTYEVGRPVGAALPAEEGGWLLADARGFTALATDGTTTPVLEHLAEADGLRSNDAACDPAGRAWAGSMALDQTPGAGTLYRLDAGPTATAVLTGLTVSNGLGWSPDGRTMWFTDSPTRRVTAFDYDVETGLTGPVRCVIDVSAHPGVPDGLCVDDEGCVWVAYWGGGVVHRYLPDGRLDTVVRVPAGQVTSCAFGGADLSTLFLTSARRRLSEGELRSQPLAGSLFALTPGVTGPPATRWKRPAPA
ncbi:MAG: SMP-30/Gluconolaconase/LRE domain protein [Nocardioides sp.]|nr:SMP-30/Gluconolaconase/LRE domain protein [Nocardioides sp.]